MVKRKYNEVIQQGGEGGDDTFEMLSSDAFADYVRRYERSAVLISKVPKREKPTVLELSAVRGRLLGDPNPVTDFPICGPFANGTARWLLSIEDVWVDGALTKRRIKNSPSFV